MFERIKEFIKDHVQVETRYGWTVLTPPDRQMPRPSRAWKVRLSWWQTTPGTLTAIGLVLVVLFGAMVGACALVNVLNGRPPIHLG